MILPKEVFVGIDVAKLRNAVAIADAGRHGEIRYLGEFDAALESMKRLVKRLATKYERLYFVMRRGRLAMGCIGSSRSSGIPAWWWRRRLSRASRATGSRPTGVIRPARPGCFGPGN
jgi:hypothetical protein